MREVDVRWLMTPEAPGVDELLAEICNRPAWHRRAACRGQGTEAFFPARGEKTDAAKAICGGCEVRAQCLEDAMAHGDRHGIWGGLSVRGRRVLRRGRAA
jgi:WhiB family redox-sensing transcriptional regulator